MLAEIHTQHQAGSNTYVLSAEADSVFGKFYNKIESEVDEYESDGYRGFTRKQGIIGMLNKSTVGFMLHK